jgi:hypothetical protein
VKAELKNVQEARELGYKVCGRPDTRVLPSSNVSAGKSDQDAKEKKK